METMIVIIFNGDIEAFCYFTCDFKGTELENIF